ncbi:hypothetical protein DBB_49060 [Desulfoluna spongiiphila]|nr:hypothetical protein DBB_49060 [Desulfoluna spongiiphila]
MNTLKIVTAALTITAITIGDGILTALVILAAISKWG